MSMPYITIKGEKYKLCVLRVESRDENNIPENLTFVPDDRTVELSVDPSQNHFILAWIKVSVASGQT